MAKKMLNREDILADLKEKMNLIPESLREKVTEIIVNKVLGDKAKISEADYEAALKSLKPTDFLK